MRFEERSGGLVITVLTTADIRLKRQTRRSFAELDEALAYVRAFAAAFPASAPASRSEEDGGPLNQ